MLQARSVEAPASRKRRRRQSVLNAILSASLPVLRKWAHGLLPANARRRADTEDLVQDALVGVIRNLGEGSSIHPKALRRYLKTAIQNKVCDEVKRARLGEVCNLGTACEDGDSKRSGEIAAESEYQREYRDALLRLGEDDKRLLIGRIELGLTYEELAVATEKPSPAAARMAARRAALRLARTMGSTTL